MGTFNFSVVGNVMKVNLAGEFDKPTVANFVTRYKAEVAKIKPAACELVITIAQMKVQTADMQVVLQECFKLYGSTGFKKIKMDVGNNVVLAMQARRIAKTCGLTNVEIK
jgi:hypothetical protein